MDSAPHPRLEWMAREGPADLRVSLRECRGDRRQVRDPVEAARREAIMVVLVAQEARRAEDSADQEVVREVAVQEVAVQEGPAALAAGAGPVVRTAKAPEAATTRVGGEDPAEDRNGWGLAG